MFSYWRIMGPSQSQTGTGFWSNGRMETDKDMVRVKVRISPSNENILNK